MSGLAGQVMPMVDRAWKSIRGGGAEKPGHNIWIYHYKGSPDRSEIVCTLTPEGRTAHTVHHGEYHDLLRVHQAIINLCAENGVARTGDNWEVYGDWKESS